MKLSINLILIVSTCICGFTENAIGQTDESPTDAAISVEFDLNNQPTITVRNARIDMPMDQSILVAEDVTISDLRIIQTGKSRFYLVGSDFKQNEKYAFAMKKENGTFIHTPYLIRHSCKVKNLEGESFMIVEGEIKGCLDGNHTITISQER